MFKSRQRRENPPKNQAKYVENEIKDSFEHSQSSKQVLSDPRGQFLVEVELENQLHTGAAVPLMSEQTYWAMFPDTPLQETKTTFKTYSGKPLRVVGQREVRVVIAGQTAKLPLTVVAGNGPTLLGRNRLWIIRLNW